MTLLRVLSHRIATFTGLAALLVAAVASPASAIATTYQYTGNPFTGGVYVGNSIVGTMTLPNPLAPNLILGGVVPTSYSFAAGPVAVTSATADSTFVQFSTDAIGTITGWSLELVDGLGTSCNGNAVQPLGPRQCFEIRKDNSQIDLAGSRIADELQALGYVVAPGTWSVVPEPSSLSLSALGLLGFGAVRRGRRRAS
jgi:hypothetical protein